MFYIKEFHLSDEDLEKIKAWDNIKTGHKCTCRSCDWDENVKYQGTIGGGLSIIFTPTSIGVFTKIKCVCGAELFLDDNM